jgi:SAM-dependent methyltransferase
VTRAPIQEEAEFENNRRLYHARGFSRKYSRESRLNRQEAIALLKYRDEFAGRDVLDLGVGTGRTTFYIAPLARRYEAVDYSPDMVGYMRAAHPSISVRAADIRDLSDFGDGSFDFVFGPAQVIDAISHEGRIRAFAEIRRVLRTGGLLVFSSHNRRYARAGRMPRLDLARNPVTQAMHLLQWMRRLVNYFRNRSVCKSETEYALFTDLWLDYGCLHYYIDHNSQSAQLARCGLQLVDVLDAEGRSLSESEPAAESPWLMYVARRAG